MSRPVLARRSLAVAFTAAVLLLSQATSASALVPRAHVLPPQSRPFGLTYGEWAARWWQWALAQPPETNPVFDETGEDCAVGQSGRVWFLAGTFSGQPVTRTCTVPLGKALFFPLLTSAFIATEPGETEELAHERVKTRIDEVDVSTLFAVIDGVSIPNLGAFRAHTPTFPVVFFGESFFPIAAADGFFLMVAPLQRGEHTIHFGGEFPGGGPTQDVTYHLTVAPVR